jgi:hypothetical protein
MTQSVLLPVQGGAEVKSPSWKSSWTCALSIVEDIHITNGKIILYSIRQSKPPFKKSQVKNNIPFGEKNI